MCNDLKVSVDEMKITFSFKKGKKEGEKRKGGKGRKGGKEDKRQRDWQEETR